MGKLDHYSHNPKTNQTNYHELTTEDDISTCRVTPGFVRECAMARHITSGPGIDKRMMPDPDELEGMNDAANLAVTRGQMFDFGYWPNDMIRETGGRAGVLYMEGALGHPFSTPYIVLHSWTDEQLPFGKMLAEMYPNDLNKRLSTCAYLVQPLVGTADDLCIDFEVTVLEGLSINGVKVLGVGDRARLDNATARKSGRYFAHVIPFLWRFPDMLGDPRVQAMGSNREGDDIAHAAVANSIDPVMVALLLLNTRGVQQTRVAAPEKLNKARARRGKPAIPPYRQVESARYVTAVMERIERVRKPPVGTHASPVMHVRQGHWREYQSGKLARIPDALVNATDEMRDKFRAGRSHYVVKKEDDRK